MPCRARRPLAFLPLLLLLPGLAGAQPVAPPGAVKPAGKEPTLALGGLLQVQVETGDRGDTRFTNGNDRIYLRRARLNATGKFLEEFDFRVELDLAGSLSNSASLRAQMTDGFINWNRNPAANVRAGQFKTPFGFEQLFGDPRLTTLERSLVNDRLTVGRQLGVQVHGELLDKRLTYAVGAFNGNGVNNNFNDDDRFLLAGRLAGTAWRGKLFGQDATLAVGGNAFSSEDTNIPLGSEFAFDSTPATADRDNIFAGKRLATGIDSQLQAGPLDLWIEFLRTRFEPDSARPRAEVTADGAYLQAGYFVWERKWQVVVKFETFDPRDDLEDDSTDALTLGGSYYFKGHDLKLMLNLARFEGPNGAEAEDKVLARLQVVF